MSLFFIVLGLISIRCVGPNPPIDPPVVAAPDTGMLALQWEQPLTGTGPSIETPIFFGGKVVVPNIWGDPNSKLLCFDQISGEKLWNWGSPVLDADDFKGSSKIFGRNNTFIGCGENQVVSVDVNTGTTNWESNIASIGYGGKRANLLGDYVYHIHENFYPTTEAHLVRSHYQYGGTWDTLCSFYMVNDYELFMAPPSLHIKPNGDSLVILHLDQLNFHTSDARSDLIAYNLATHAIEWRKDDFEPTGNCNVRPVTIYDSKVYIMGKYILHCFDANTGQKLWEKPEPGGLMGSVNLTIAEGKVFVKPTNSHFKAYDAQTGDLVWDVSSSTVSPNGSVYYKGHLFITGADIGIFVHRASDGKLVYLKQMPGRDHLYQPISIDTQTGLLFTSDSRKALCFKIDL